MRLPIKLRLTIAVAAILAVLLAAAGGFLYARLGAELLRATDAALRAEATAVASGLGEGGAAFGDQGAPPAGGIQAFAQVLDARGRVIESSEAIQGPALVSATTLATITAPTFLDRAVPGVKGTARLLVTPESESGRRVYVIAVASLADRQDVLRRLALLLAIGGPIGLAVGSLAAWLIASAALRPVERMREEAAAISVSDRDSRLSVPITGDEVARLGSTLNSMLDRMQEAFNRERRFVEDASHELRTPLSILKAELELALSPSRTEDQLKTAVRSASDEADRLAALAEDLLIYSQADRGRVPIHRTEVALPGLMTDATARWVRRGESARVRVDVQADDCAARVDAIRLRQAIENVMANAVRHTPAGGWIRVTARCEGDALLLVFDDSGSGFPPDLLHAAFEPFTRASDQRARDEGAGLGLAIVRAIAQAHDGTASAENRADGGARVTLTLRNQS